MQRFRNSYTNYEDGKSEEIISEEYTHSEEKVNGQIHKMGTKKNVNLCSNTFAENHFPNPKDYTLENLIKSGANLQEVNSQIEQNDEQVIADAERLSNRYEQDNKE